MKSHNNGKLFCHTMISFFTCKTDTSIHVHAVFSEEIQKLLTGKNVLDYKTAGPKDMTDLIQHKKNYSSLVGYFAGKAEAQSKSKK